MNQLNCSSSSLARIDKLLREAERLLDAKKVRRLRIVLALCQGKPGAQIADARKVSAAAVSGIKRKLLLHGIESEIERFEHLLAVASAKAAQPKSRQRGRPGYRTREVWAKGVKINDEPFVELAALIIAPGAKVAVFAVRQAAGRRHPVSRIFESPVVGAPQWTQLSIFDGIVSEFFRRISRVSSSARLDRNTSALRKVRYLSSVFETKETHFYVLEEGDPKICKALITSRLMKAFERAHRVERTTQLGFFEQLERMIYAVRERWNSIGLLPARWDLLDDLNRWEEKGFSGPFIWQTSLKETVGWLKAHSVVQTYFAAYGQLFELTPDLWRKAPFNDEVSFKTVPLNPKIEVLKHDPSAKQATIRVSPLPNIGYDVLLSCDEPPDKFATRVRKTLLAHRRTAGKLLYSTRARNDGLRAELIMPPELLAGDEEKWKTDRGAAVSLLARHFLFSQPEVPLEELWNIAQTIKPGICCAKSQDGSLPPRVICNLPELLGAIHSAFGANKYGDSLRRLYTAQTLLVEGSLALSENSRWAVSLARLQPCAGLYYYFPEIGTPGEIIPRQVHAEEAQLVIQRAPEFFGEDCFGSRARPWRGVETNREAFRELLLNVDADFLLVGIASEARVKLDDLSRFWAQAVSDRIKESFWESSTQQELADKLMRVLPSGYEKNAYTQTDDLLSWAAEVLPIFSQRRASRLLRRVIETAQRFLLAGYEPAMIAVETEESLVRSWRKFLGRSLRGRILDQQTNAKEGRAVSEEYFVALTGRDPTNKRKRKEGYDDYEDG